MQNPLPLLCLGLLLGCQSGNEPKTNAESSNEGKEINVAAFQQIIDSAQVTGSVLVYDPQKDIYYSNDFVRARRGFLPASTFKIPNSLIALETGVVTSDSSVFLWDGKKRRLPVWEQDLTFREAFHLSCVPCYQEIARKIGVERMNDYLEKFRYGSMVVTDSTLDKFWLEGESTITQFQQINFLAGYYYWKLPIRLRTFSIMKRLMVIEVTDRYTLSGKTGWAIRDQNNYGWFVGFLESGKDVYFIATNIEPEESFNMDLFPKIRTAISLKALMYVLDTY